MLVWYSTGDLRILRRYTSLKENLPTPRPLRCECQHISQGRNKGSNWETCMSSTWSVQLESLWQLEDLCENSLSFTCSNLQGSCKFIRKFDMETPKTRILDVLIIFNDSNNNFSGIWIRCINVAVSIGRACTRNGSCQKESLYAYFEIDPSLCCFGAQHRCN